MKDNETGGNKP